MPYNPYQAVNFGGGMSPAMQADPRYRVAQALMSQGMSAEPVRHPLQGLAKILQAYVGNQKLQALEGEAKARQAAQAENIASAISAGKAWVPPDDVMAGPSGSGPEGDKVVVPAGTPAPGTGGVEGIAATLMKNADNAPMGLNLLVKKAMQQPEEYTLKPGETRFRGGQPLASLPAADPKDPAFVYRINALMETGVPRDVAVGIAAGRFVESRDPISGNAQIIDKATGNIVSRAGNRVSSPTAQADIPTTADPRIDYSQGTGSSGFFGWAANTVGDALSGKLPAPEAEKATQGLKNLQVKTQLALQAGVPGRPSNYLMQRLDELAVAPGSIFQGDRRAYERLQQTRDMIREEISRIDQDILGQSEGFRPAQVAEARANRSQLDRLARNYDVVVNSFARTLGPQKGTPAPKSIPEGAVVRQGDKTYRNRGGVMVEEGN